MLRQSLTMVAIVNIGAVGTDQRRLPRTYRSNRRASQACRTRQRVLDAATAEFLAHGYAGATIPAIATGAAVSVPTVESLFGTKARVLKAAIDVAIAGDDEPVPVLDRAGPRRPWRRGHRRAPLDRGRRDRAGPGAVRRPGARGLRGSSTDAALAALAARMTAQRAGTPRRLVDALTRKAPLRAGCTRQEAVDTVGPHDPAVFDRLIRQRHWTRSATRTGSPARSVDCWSPTPWRDST